MTWSPRPDRLSSGTASDRGPLMGRRHLLQAAGIGGLAAAAPGFTSHQAVARPSEGSPSRPVPDEEALRLWYRGPGSESQIIEQGLPAGNGRLGTLAVGAPEDTVHLITDASMWSGDVNDTVGSNGQFSYAVEDFGTFQLLVRARVRLDGHGIDAVSDYTRALDLSNGVLVTTYRKDGVAYRQETFVSHPDDVIVTRLSCSAGGSHTGSVRLEATRDGEDVGLDEEGRAVLSDSLDNGLRYAAVADVSTRRGRTGTADGAVTFSDADEVVIVISGGTNYVPDHTTSYLDGDLDVLALAHDKASRALRVPGKVLLLTHVRDYRRLFDTFELNLGSSTAEQRALPTDERLAARGTFFDGTPDPEFESLYLQYARYLTITGSRTSLSTNLQALWIDNNTPDWMADYHTDINHQMNYWPTHRFGLGELAEPFLDHLLSQLPEWERITQQHFNDPRNAFRNTTGRIAGWTTSISHNIWGGHGWLWHPAGNAWYCLELWQHYQYRPDRELLAKMMPLLRGATEFWEARLIEVTVGEGDGSRVALVGDTSWSPEHGPYATGITYDQELVHALFGIFAEAATVLGTDAELASRVTAMRERLYLPEVSPRTGRLQEWRDPDDLGDLTHRHLSHLMGWYPGDRIRLDNQPAEYVEGVRATLEARGFDSYGWAVAWRAACWARLKDANRAYLCLLSLLRPHEGHPGGTGPNLFDLYRTNRYIFQIDANYGAAAAMLEMVVHATPDVVDLMPAVPQGWADGSVRGMALRGGFTLDMTWADGAPTEVTLHSVGGTETEVRVGEWSTTVRLRPGASRTLRPQARPLPPPPAPEPPPVVQRVRNVGSGLVMEVFGGGTAAGGEIGQWVDSGSTSQSWEVRPEGEDVILVSVRSGLAVERGAGGAGAGLTQQPVTGDADQRFRLDDVGQGRVRLVSAVDGLVIGIVGDATSAARCELQAPSSAATQQWEVTPR